MRILILNWKDVQNPSAGGAEVIVFHLARRLTRDNHPVTVFVRSFPGCKPEENIDGIKILRRGSLLTVYLHAWQFYRQHKNDFDLVIDMVNTLPWQTPLYVPRKKRVAYVNQLAQEVFFFHLPPIISHLAYLFERLLYLPYKNTNFLCYSDSTKKDLQKFGISPKKISVFPLGLDHEQYKPGLEKSSDPLFVFVARLVKMKRPDVCIEAMQIVAKKFPQAKLIIIGRGPEEAALQEKIKTLGLEQNVMLLHRDAQFLTNQDQQKQKVELMQKAWALLLPSVKEGWGMVVTEAAACGTPAIVSNVTGLRDSTLHNQTGLVLSPFPSASEFAEAMLKIIEDEPLRARLSTGALAWSKTFDWEKSYQSFVSNLTSTRLLPPEGCK